MSRHMSVRVVDRDGRPEKGARIGCYIHRFLASGFKPHLYADSQGQVAFILDDDSRVTLYVDGSEIKPGERKPEAMANVIL